MADTAKVNSTTSAFFLETVENSVKEGFKRYYPGTETLTKHFRVSSVQDPKIFRHYTTCNAMNPPVYQEYLRALRYAMDNNGQAPPDFNRELVFDDASREKMMFVIKNYNREGGVSMKFHDNDQANHEFTVKGPMGKGLMPGKGGQHIAFAAGTGALCFVDLIAYMITRTIGLVAEKDNIQTVSSAASPQQTSGDEGQLITRSSEAKTEGLDVTFKLNMYLSFVSRKDAVGLELFEEFDKYCKKFNKPDFSLFLRLSNEKMNPQRWDNQFIQ